MRRLSDPPSAILDSLTRVLAVGSFRGGVGSVDPGLVTKSRVFRVRHEKRWIYMAIAADDLLVCAAVVRLGYASNCFVFAFDRAAGRIVSKYSTVAPRIAASVGDTGGDGCHARFRWLGAHVSIERGRAERDYRVEVKAPDLRVSARLSTETMPPRIGAIAALPAPPSGLFNATEKGVLLPVVGEAIIGGKHYDLDGGLAGYDFTAGLLARHTAWRWAFALGRTRNAERVAVNLVQGFVGEAECAVWIDGELFPVSEGRIEMQEGRPLAPWTVRTRDGEVDLRFEPGDVHAESHDFGVIASKFIQPAGSYSGVIRLPGRDPIEIDRILGVAEDQDVLW
ncbi:Hypothetical protein A7982_04104 [Minicystis rosea]|nr:Hypothetical protein A7982_04104 [Minicystis rosea]